MKRLIIINLILFWITSSIDLVHGQSLGNPVDSFSIIQTVLPGANPEFEYAYENDKLTIFKIQGVEKKGEYIKKKKRIYSTHFNEGEIESLDSILTLININKLDSNYSNASLDGIYWSFIFQQGDKRRIIVLDNYYLEELDLLLAYLNKQLPQKMRLISLKI